MQALSIWVDGPRGKLFSSVGCDFIRLPLPTVADVFSHSSLQHWHSIRIILIHSLDTLSFSELDRNQGSACEHLHGHKEVHKERGDQNWCSKIANYLLDVFILIYSNTNRKCFKTLPLHPLNRAYGQKNYFL